MASVNGNAILDQGQENPAPAPGNGNDLQMVKLEPSTPTTNDNAIASGSGVRSAQEQGRGGNAANRPIAGRITKRRRRIIDVPWVRVGEFLAPPPARPNVQKMRRIHNTIYDEETFFYAQPRRLRILKPYRMATKVKIPSREIKELLDLVEAIMMDKIFKKGMKILDSTGEPIDLISVAELPLDALLKLVFKENIPRGSVLRLFQKFGKTLVKAVCSYKREVKELLVDEPFMWLSTKTFGLPAHVPELRGSRTYPEELYNFLPH